MTSAPRHVTAVLRALEVLDAFAMSEPRITVSDLARKTGLPKSTALRLARTLESRGYLVQLDSGAWRLGPSTAWLAARYQVAFDLQGVVYPALKRLSRVTGKTASFFVHEGDARVRLIRIEGDGQAMNAHVGEQLPLDRGSAGKVILAFTGLPGQPYDDIRRLGYHVTIGEAFGHLASVAAPVFGAGWSVVGALSVSCMRDSVTVDDLVALAPAVMTVARNLSSALLREAHGRPAAQLPMGYWHP
jgi:DNA-binding IclR family transcriptional regulator